MLGKGIVCTTISLTVQSKRGRGVHKMGMTEHPEHGKAEHQT